MEGPPIGPGGEDITWPNQVAPRGQKASSTRKIKPQTSNLASTHPRELMVLASRTLIAIVWAFRFLVCFSNLRAWMESVVPVSNTAL